MANFVSAVKTSELTNGVKKGIFVSGKRLMIVAVDGKYFAMDDACSHAGCSLATEGTIEGQTITCGCHGSQFDLASGHVLGPPATVPMKTYEVKVEGDTILVAV